MKTLFKLLILWVVFSMFIFPYQLAAEQKALDGKSVMEKTLNAYYYAQNDGKAHVFMRLVNKEGKERIRDFTMLRLDKEDGGDQYYYAYFTKPPDVNRTVFMVWKHIDRDDDRWLYLPAIDLVKRISANDKRSSYVGSDFTYEDVSGRHLNDDEHTLVKEEAVNGKNAYKIKSIPKDKGEVEFNYRFVWADKETFLPLKVEYYNRRDELYKEMITDKIEIIEGTPTVTKATMKDIKGGHYTEIEFKKIDYNVGLKKNIFAERYLRKPPVKWIR